jgi:hypothetical protein
VVERREGLSPKRKSPLAVEGASNLSVTERATQTLRRGSNIYQGLELHSSFSEASKRDFGQPAPLPPPPVLPSAPSSSIYVPPLPGEVIVPPVSVLELHPGGL